MTATTAAVLLRNEDPLTVALRSKTESDFSLDELVDLNQTDQDFRQYASTLGTLTSTELSSQEESSATKPTSAGTIYEIKGYIGKGKGKVVTTYASSLSATHGSASEAEVEQDNALFGVGDQFESNPLRGAARARKRPRVSRSWKPKKVPLVIHQDPPGLVSSEEETVPEIYNDPHRNNQGKSYMRTRRSKTQSNRLGVAEEERISPADKSNPTTTRLPRVRINIIIGLCVLIVFTFALSVFAAHYTGKGRLACTKGIIFCATVLLSLLTVLVMNMSGRALQEVLLAGLLEFVIGFALVMEIRDFMEHVS